MKEMAGWLLSAWWGGCHGEFCGFLQERKTGLPQDQAGGDSGHGSRTTLLSARRPGHLTVRPRHCPPVGDWSSHRRTRTLSRCSPCPGASSWSRDCVSLGKTGRAGGPLPPPTPPPHLPNASLSSHSGGQPSARGWGAGITGSPSQGNVLLVNLCCFPIQAPAIVSL